MARKWPKKASGGGGGRQQQQGWIPKSIRIRIGKILEDFRASDSQVYTFEPRMSKQERAALHEICHKMGMLSKSSGYGDRGCLYVYKTLYKQKPNNKDEETAPCLSLSKEAKYVLRDLFNSYPPDDVEGALKSCSEVALQLKPDSSFCKPKMRKAEIAKKVEILAKRSKEDPHLRKITEGRGKLPIAAFNDVITSKLETQQVVLIAGDTGCGKTTQVPQYILDYMWGKGGTCKIVCTQPRQISAISVAERISYERGETVGDTVGYKIRLESEGGRQSSVMFCTNDVLLRLLINRCKSAAEGEIATKSVMDVIQGITHIIMDEIHERDRFSDFMLAILRDLLPAYPHLRLILMSATINTDRFSQYFGGCPIIQVPGFTHPVKTFYLEDVISILRSADDKHLHLADLSTVEDAPPLSEDRKAALDESIDLALTSDEFDPLLELLSSGLILKVYNYQHSLTGVSPLMVFAGKGRVGDVCMLLSFGAHCSLTDKDGSSALDWAQRENQHQVYDIIREHIQKDSSKSAEKQELLEKYLSSTNPERINIVLIDRLLKKICRDSEEGAIIVFLSGWDDINQTKEKLLASPFFQNPSKFIIFSLHSMIPSAEQKKVFKHLPSGVRKIILSTNIAETAVTIDDVVFVIDSGRMKEKSYDPCSNVSTLHSSWVSKASAKQREGRAGRCQPGTCYHLYSKIQAASLPDDQVPEIKMMPIEELCLQVKLLDPHCGIADFLQKTLDPPDYETMRNGIIVLRDIGALTQDENLTDLGKKLGALPVHPSTGKMLLFSILMNCLEPALTLACAADYIEPFLLPIAPEDKKKASDAKVELASLYGGYSDQLAVVAAFECWKRAKDRGQESQFCSRYFVSSNTMRMLFHMRKQLQTELVRIGFIPEDMSSCNLNAQDAGILRAVLTAGSYPMVGRLLPPRKQNERTMVETVSGAKVGLDPHSSNFKLSFSRPGGNPIIIYDEVTRGDGGVYIKTCSLVGPYPLLLLALELAVAPTAESDDDLEASSGNENKMENNTCSGQEQIMSSPDNNVSVVVDRWLKFESTAPDVAQIYCLRERLTAAMLFKVKSPQEVLPAAIGAAMSTIACILSHDGLSRISPDDDALDSHGAKLDAADKNMPASRRKGVACIMPGPLLRSLMADNTRESPSHSHKVRGSLPDAPPPRRRRHQNPRKKSQVELHGQAAGAAAAAASGCGSTSRTSTSRNSSSKRRWPGKG